uniref:Uncharacterized protein n=1 Tax=Timema poppense TaxID=170557 RepID=A0A7R9H430_TIMPO|nr:unnamed protein product [Timema poppensis]
MYLYLLAVLLCGLAVVVQGFMARLAFIEECGEKRREGAPASAGLGLIKFNVQNTFQKYHNQFIIEGGTFSIPFPLDQHVSVSNLHRTMQHEVMYPNALTLAVVARVCWAGRP